MTSQILLFNKFQTLKEQSKKIYNYQSFTKEEEILA